MSNDKSKPTQQLISPKKATVPRQRITVEVPDLAEQNLEELRTLFPSAFADGKIDFEKLRNQLGDSLESGTERFSFAWVGKRNAIRILQTPSRATLLPSVKESVSFTHSGNLFVEGDNLEAMKLLHPAYFGRIKMIYIDPPYNTGNDFVYPDNYFDPLDAYLRVTGQSDDKGNLQTSNPETSGRFHSTWLSMMYPRLFLARQLLKDDGSIWISIDDMEYSKLKLACDEIFGEENFVATFIWEKRTTRENRRVFSFNHDFILCYARDKVLFQSSRNMLPFTEEALQRYKNPDNDPRGAWQSVSLNAQAGHATPAQFYDIVTPSGRKLSPPPGRCWSVTNEKLKTLIADNRVWFGKNGDSVPRLKVFLSDTTKGLTPHTIWKAEEVGTNDSAKKALIELFSGKAVMDTPKPVNLVKRMIQISTSANGNDLVLDFFAGSCTTAQAVLELNAEDNGNRRFMMIQIPEPTPLDSEAFRAGFKNIADIGKERIRKYIGSLAKKTKSKLKLQNDDGPSDLGFRAFALAKSNYRLWNGVKELSPEEYGSQMASHLDSLDDGWTKENVLYEVLIKEGLSLTSRIDAPTKGMANEVICVTDDETNRSILVCLDDKIRMETITNLKVSKEDLFVCRDIALNDTTAANLATRCRLKTI